MTSEQSQTPPASNTKAQVYVPVPTPGWPSELVSLKDYHDALRQIERLRHESEAWDKASLVAIIADRDRLTVERDQLLTAIGGHVTVRSDQYALIQQLTRERDSAREALRISEQRVREHWPERDRLREVLVALSKQRPDDDIAALLRRIAGSPDETPSAPASNTNACEVCGAPAVQWVLSDPFGKSDARRPLCIDHGMRLRDQEDVAEIERLRGRLDLIGRLSAHQPVVLAIQIAREALNGDGGAPETTASPQAPIARIKIKADRCYAVEFYAPGLPPGEHDLYCEPEAVAPMMREKRAYYETHDPPHCPTCACGLPREDACSCGRVELKDGYVRETCADGSVHTKGGCNSPSKASVCMGCNSTPCVCAELGGAQEACAKPTPDGPCRSAMGHDGECDGVPY